MLRGVLLLASCTALKLHDTSVQSLERVLNPVKNHVKDFHRNETAGELDKDQAAQRAECYSWGCASFPNPYINICCTWCQFSYRCSSLWKSKTTVTTTIAIAAPSSCTLAKTRFYNQEADNQDRVLQGTWTKKIKDGVGGWLPVCVGKNHPLRQCITVETTTIDNGQTTTRDFNEVHYYACNGRNLVRYVYIRDTHFWARDSCVKDQKRTIPLEYHSGTTTDGYSDKVPVYDGETARWDSTNGVFTKLKRDTLRKTATVATINLKGGATNGGSASDAVTFYYDSDIEFPVCS